MKRALVTALALFLGIHSAAAITVAVIGRDAPVKLDTQQFVRYEPEHSRTIKIFYYDAANQYLIYQIRTLYYQRCGVPAEIVDEWAKSDLPDSYFTRRIKGRYECHGDNVPTN